MDRNMSRTMRLLGGFLGAAALFAGFPERVWGAPASMSPAAGERAYVSAGDKDVLYLKNGTKVEGEILSETDTTIKFKVIAAGGITAERTFDKSEVLSIERATKDAPKDAPKETPKQNPVDAPKAPQPVAAAKPAVNGKKIDAVGDENGSKIYLVTLTGEFQRDVNLTPMKMVLEDAKKNQPDVLVVKIDCDFKFQGRDLPDFAGMGDANAFNDLELARQIAVMLTDEIEESPAWKVKPRLVFWVRKALGGVAFVPFVSKEIYYTSDAHHGGIGYLDFLFEGVGDEVVQRKQQSLRLARAIGLSLKGGHPQEILKAMAEMEYVLSVSFEGGKPVFHEDESGDIPLTDDGNKQKGRRDTIDQVARFQGNDVLTLDAETAKRVGMSSGTIDNTDQLLFALGVSRNYKMLPAKGDQIIQDWGKAVRDAELTFRRLERDLGRVTVKPPGGYKERTEARGKKKSIYKEMLTLILRYKESLNPRALGENPMSLDDWETRLNLLITQIEQEQRRDKPD